MHNQQLIELKKLFSWALTWSTIEALSYYLILTGHLIALFFKTDATFYSIQGSLFAILYLFITIGNGALELAMIPVFSVLNKTAEGKNYLFNKIFIQFFILFSIPFLTGLILKYYFIYLVPSWSLIFLNYKALLLFSFLVACEGTKKNLRALLHLTLHYKILATLEFCNIIGYVGLIWGSYFYGLTISIPLIIISFLGVSFITTLVLLIIILYHYAISHDFLKNKHLKLFEYKIITNTFFTTRVYSFINQIIRTLFSGNFLLPFFTLKIGIINAGLVTLINGITYTSASIIQRIFGSVGSTLFAHTQDSSENKQHVFNWLTSTSHKASFLFFIIFLINIPNFIQLSTEELSTHAISLIVLFFLVHLVESSFIVYEKLLIVQEKAYLLVYLNSGHGLFCFLLSYYWKNGSLVLLFSLCLASRLLFLTLFKRLYDQYR